MRLFLAALALTPSLLAQPSTPDTGTWRAQLDSPGGALRFGLVLSEDSTGWSAWLQNGDERIRIRNVSYADRKFTFDFAPYDSRIEAEVRADGSTMRGIWRKRRGADRFTEMPFRASSGMGGRTPGVDTEATGVDTEATDVGGRWRVQFSSSDEPAVGIFRVAGSRAQGTFLTTVGDYRFLAGTARNGELELSCFDGAHAFLFRAKQLDDGTLSGDFWSRDSWHETWTATRDEKASTGDPFALTTWRGRSGFGDLAFPDLDGKPRRLDDPEFAGKARILVVFGTWCPNCKDATALMARLHQRYAARGLSVLGLAFELTGDVDRDRAQVRRYCEDQNVGYPVLIAGMANKAKASEAFPLLDRVRAYPTTVFLDGTGGVHTVHTGFSGPASGAAYDELVDRFESTIEELLQSTEDDRGTDDTKEDAGPGEDAEAEAAPDFPGEALRWRSLRWLSENGTIPPGAWQRALDSWRQNTAAQPEVAGGGIAPAAWEERGPYNVAGRTRTLVIDPRNPDLLWSGGVSGGLWKSTNAGQSWDPIGDWWTNLAISTMAMAETDPDVMYVGTGEGFYNFNVGRGVNASHVRGAGIFKTVDGGQSWTQLPATAAWPFVTRVAISPNDPNLILASTRTGGVQRSADGGQTWTNVLPAHASYQVVFDPNNPANAVAHVMNAALNSHWVERSTDGGVTWTRATSGLSSQSGYDARIEMCYAKSNPGVVYASVGNSGGKIWRSADGGRTWVQRTTSGSTGAMWYYNGFWVDPTNENNMVVGAFHVWRSTDGGRSVTQITDGYIMTTDPHLDVHHVVADPRYNGSSNRRVYVMTDGGVHVADDILTARRRSGWRDLDNSCRSTQIYGADGDGRTGLIIAGLQDNGTQRLRGTSNISNMPFGGDGGYCAIDPTNNSYVYGEYVWLRVHRSTNGGSSSRFIYSGISDASNGRANFVAPLVLDPNNPARLYGGGRSLWRTDNARASGVSWRAVKPNVGSLISAIVIHDGDPNRVWVGHNDGRIYRTANGTSTNPTWIAVDDNAGTDPLPDRYVTRIVIDSTDPNRAYVAFGGFEADNFWRTTNGGTSWTTRVGSGTTSLPPAPINGIAQHPNHPDVLYVATEVGIYATGDAGLSWSASNDGPANVVVDEIRFMHHSTRLLAATLGRGIWTADVELPTVTSFGAACAGHQAAPQLTATAPRIGAMMTCSVSPSAPGSAFLLLGISNTTLAGGNLPVDLGVTGMTGCQLLVSNESVLNGTVQGGSASWPLALPADSNLLGKTLYTQAFVPAPGLNALGLGVSNGLELTLGW